MMQRAGISMVGAALFAGAGAWTLQQQAGYVTVSWVCGPAASGPVWLITAAAVVFLVLGTWFTWRPLRLLLTSDSEDSGRLRPRRFLGLIAIMAAALFLFTILLRASAALLLPGCLG